MLAGRQLHDFLAMLREFSIANEQHNFTNKNSFSDEEFRIISPVSKQQFDEIVTYCDPIPQLNGRRYIKEKDVLLFLCKLRQELPDDFLKLLFKYNSRQAVSLAVANVRQSLMLRFVPENIGLGAITREGYIQRHVTDFANTLYNPDVEDRQIIVYIDGTYSYIEKSTNYRALRWSYFVHKGRHLVKPALMVAPDGYILDIHGPYFSDYQNNDAAMLEKQFEDDAGALREWLGEGGIVIVDRGYRDVLPLLNRLGIDHRMPGILEPGQFQPSTEVANDSRLITKTRWIIEARNGHIKTIFKFFKDIIPFHHANHLREFYLIAGAIINKYREPIHMEGATAELALNILERELMRLTSFRNWWRLKASSVGMLNGRDSIRIRYQIFPYLI